MGFHPFHPLYSSVSSYIYMRRMPTGQYCNCYFERWCAFKIGKRKSYFYSDPIVIFAIPGIFSYLQKCVSAISKKSLSPGVVYTKSEPRFELSTSCVFHLPLLSDSSSGLCSVLIEQHRKHDMSLPEFTREETMSTVATNSYGGYLPSLRLLSIYWLLSANDHHSSHTYKVLENLQRKNKA